MKSIKTYFGHRIGWNVYAFVLCYNGRRREGERFFMNSITDRHLAERKINRLREKKINSIEDDFIEWAVLTKSNGDGFRKIEPKKFRDLIKGPFLTYELNGDYYNLFTLLEGAFNYNFDLNWKDVK